MYFPDGASELANLVSMFRVNHEESGNANRITGPDQGSGANPKPGQIRSVSCYRFEGDSDYAARAACQISGILAVRPPSLPILN
jgi:hypothetical protein